MEVSMQSQAIFLAFATLIGIALGLLYDALRISRIFMGVKYAHKTVEKLDLLNLPLIGRAADKKSSKGMKIFKNSVVDTVVFIEDIVFFIICAAVLVVCIFAASYGEARSFAFAGCAAGFFAYFFTLGRLVMFLSEYVVFGIRTFIRYFIFFTINPILWLYKRIKYIIIRETKKLAAFISRKISSARENIRAKKAKRILCAELLSLSKKGFIKE
jgi:hypothetical protein